jgi:hypothetical protein
VSTEAWELHSDQAGLPPDRLGALQIVVQRGDNDRLGIVGDRIAVRGNALVVLGHAGQYPSPSAMQLH